MIGCLPTQALSFLAVQVLTLVQVAPKFVKVPFCPKITP